MKSFGLLSCFGKEFELVCSPGSLGLEFQMHPVTPPEDSSLGYMNICLGAHLPEEVDLVILEYAAHNNRSKCVPTRGNQQSCPVRAFVRAIGGLRGPRRLLCVTGMVKFHACQSCCALFL